jgi:MFS family permease
MRILVKQRIERVMGGPARTRVVLIFGSVLALESADLTAVGAAGPQLQASLHISNAQLGLLAAISTLVGAVATVPFGALADRLRRVSLLEVAIVLWGGAMAVSAAASGYEWLVLSRMGLGAVTAAAGPLIASMTGDFFPAAERAKIYGYILSGELLGAGFGFVVSGSLAGALSWRWAFAVLTVPALMLAAVIRHGLPEPARGGQSRLDPGARRIVGADDAARENGRHPDQDETDAPPGATDEIARRAVARQRVEPIRENVLHEDPEQMPLRRAVRYVLSVRTNRWLIVASAVGYFFFAGMRTFALVFVRGSFSLGQASATVVLFLGGLGSLAGVLLAGRLADRMIRAGRLDARVLVGAVSYIVAAALLAPTLLVGVLVVAVPLLMVAGAALAAPNPPLDAARLDIVPARLWGRAEGVRALVRQSAQAAAPVLFGLVADALGGATTGLGSGGHVSAATTTGLRYAFLIMLVPLVFSGLALLAARGSYAADVATAIASDRGGAPPAAELGLPRSERGDERKARQNRQAAHQPHGGVAVSRRQRRPQGLDRQSGDPRSDQDPEAAGERVEARDQPVLLLGHQRHQDRVRERKDDAATERDQREDRQHDEG